MNSTAETPEVPPRWRVILKQQGRTLTWLAQATGKTYPTVTHYANGRLKAPPEWVEKVYELLGETAA